MRIAALVLFSACTIAPKLVSVPMSDTAEPTHAETAPSSDPSDTVEDDDSTSDDFKGEWTGNAWGAGNKTSPMTVTFEKRGRELVGRVYYTDRHCRAEWTMRRVQQSHWEGAENVSVDPFNRCPNNARVFLDVIDEDTIRWRSTGSGGATNATLQRTQQ
jgi:hypothetical protein